MSTTGARTPPQIFLSYTTQDAEIAEKVARALLAGGIDVWWARWEIRSGDSLRQKIEEALGDCTHFVVLLTPNSVDKPWVNLEIDAALIRRLRSQCVLIPLRCDVPPQRLPPLLAGLHSPAIDVNGDNVGQLINDIHGVSDKPRLGAPPAVIAEQVRNGYSAAANRIAKLFVTHDATTGEFGAPQFQVETLIELTSLSREEVSDGLHELRRYLRRIQASELDVVIAEPWLFAEWDQHWMGWNPAQYALRIAADMVNDPRYPSDPAEISQRYGWEPRRLNPALTYLHRRGAISMLTTMGMSPYVGFRVVATDETRRYVRASKGV